MIMRLKIHVVKVIFFLNARKDNIQHAELFKLSTIYHNFFIYLDFNFLLNLIDNKPKEKYM